MPPTLHTDRCLVRASGGSRRFIVVRLVAPSAPSGRARPAADVAFVIDRSGSMVGQKIAHARAAVVAAIELLDDRDHFAVVAYDHAVELVAPAARATPQNRERAVRAVRALEPRGNTDLHAGWMEGARNVLATLDRAAVGRCLVLTDGLTNAGTIDPHALAHKALDLRARGVSTSTFGIGADFDEGLLGRLADAGGGTFRFIERHEQIVRFMRDELGEALDVVARDVAVHLDLPRGVELKVVGPWIAACDGATARVELPDLVSQQSLEVVIELRFPAAPEGTSSTVSACIASRDDALGLGATQLVFQYADHPANDAQPRDLDVDRLVAQRFAGAARERATLQNRDGDLGGAASELLRVARRIRTYAGGDPVLGQLALDLEREASAMRMPIDPLQLKRMHFEASAAVRSKQADGRSRRRGPP